MNCVLCKAGMEQKTVNHVVDIQGQIIIVKNVPANVCLQCGEYYIDNEVARKLESIVEQTLQAGTEVSIISYPDKVA
ncbi:MAG: type II toxin-antitoxin system MqsA family antitoxin [Syntrophomonas sp.]|jgi:YgiT-type zinc finger domain-containing protein|uniref:Type II toxin-antitoxin system MqsA family antitoxin n=1 Tax=Syntrophomonas wolfei TaxID=863 RepID=A0A354YWA4_9FIRM|nr:type II toxin-antitoxin system MqsA family antitoxin [Syntrophomonas wolfei]MDD3880365.1 type II toxin-antitoxin system MqsA family antitoxin [Syntrophomonas sp.]HBK53484.1 type II toxin-antitoxin system MqsA family antitoxin [Syntrophomonas wolfei]